MRDLLRAGSIAAIAVCMAGAAQAQEVTSSIRGTVVAANAPVAGAAVTVTHVPSGTVATTTTGEDGTFTASGLRVGGPFTVKVVAPNYPETSITGVQLTAGQPLRLPVMLDQGAEIVVTGGRTRAVELSSGPITALGREAIEGVASVQRDIRDLARRDPFASIDPNSRGIVIAGQNPRLNRFSVDGQRFSDNFGLNNGGLPTARGPVPLDAIEQFTVKTAPYDVTEGDFQGGAINVVLRSGNNRFSGSAFYTYSDDSLTGDRTKPSFANRTGSVNLDFKSKNFGGFLSGPIIRDTLFFALSYENLKESTPVNFGLAGFPNVVPNVTQTQLDQIGQIAQSRYGYDTLGLLNSFIEKDEKYTAKIDWNVTDGQRLSATYIHNKGVVGQDPGFSTVSPTSPALSYASNLYNRPETVDSATVQLNSDWSDNFHTELRGNYREYDLLPSALGARSLGQFQVCLDPTAATQANGAANSNLITCSQGNAAAPGAARLYFGPDQFRQANLVQTVSYGVDLVTRWEYGDHSLKLQVAYDHQKARNVFVQNALGSFYFDSIADFAAGRAGTFALGGAITGNLGDIEANFQYEQWHFGLQDSWDVTDRLNVTYGVRSDLFAMDDRPPLNTAFLGRFGFPNTFQYSGKTVIQPRFGLTWKATDQLELRGGIGLFSGGSPDVFIGNSFSVPGVLNNAINIQRTAADCNVPASVPDRAAICAGALNGVTGANFSSAVLNYLNTNTGSIALAPTNSMDPDYKPQSTWKTSFSADYRPEFDWLGSGWTFGGDVYYGFTNNAPYYLDLRLTQIGTLPDGRPRYGTTTAGNPNNDLFLTNTKRGHSLVAVARFEKQFDFDLNVGASYTFQDVTEFSPMNGTTASGSYGQAAMIDPNRPAYGTSIYEVRNSIKFHLDYDHAFFGDYKTRFSLFGERRSGLPYSLTMNDPNFVNSHSTVFGVTGTSNRFLLYVPNMSSITADALVSYDSQATFDAMSAYVNAAGLKQGAIVKKNSQRAPSFFKIDLHVDQEVPLPAISTGRIKLFADMENVLNFINKDWGSLRQIGVIGSSTYAPLVNVSCVATGTGASANPCGQYRYSNFLSPTLVNPGRLSLWSLRVGAKFEF
ncbi:MAG: hypothetical protein JWL91_2005 [Sphingomonas bacterium]|nr:TonB-dependent receptor [Sphingomonas bacterium]MDB5690129.1 hypothetical protein [Sphingomonas bacterium]